MELKSILKPSSLVFWAFLLLLCIPKTRRFVQVNLNKVFSFIKTVEVIDEEDQKTIVYAGQLTGIGSKKNIDFENLNDKVVFVNFWATWCPPCIAEMQSLQDLYNDYKKDVIFLFITNDSAEVTQLFLQKHNYDMPCYNPKTPLPLVFDHVTIPTTFIVNKKRKVVVQKEGVLNWNKEKVHEILNELIRE